MFGQLSRAFLLSRGRVAHLFASLFFGLDALSSTALLRYLLRRNDVVIFVRYLLSAAYLPDAMARPVHDWFASFLPDAEVKVYVDTRPDVAMARIRGRDDAREMFETPEALHAVRGRVGGLLDSSWTILDNNGTLWETRRQVEGLLPRVLGPA